MTSWFSSWWKSSPPPPPSSVGLIDETYEALENLEDKCMQERFKSHNLEKEARELKRQGKTKEALQLLKRKHAVDQRVKQMEGQIANLERTVSTMDATATATDLAHVMRSGNELMRAQLNAVSLSEVEGIADDLNETMIEAHELGEALSRPMGLDDAEEVDAELMKEMQGWDEEREEREAREVLEKFPNPILSSAGSNGNGKGGGSSQTVEFSEPEQPKPPLIAQVQKEELVE